MNVGIVGAGLSGLTLARQLQTRGHRVLVLDKGRGVGGRVSTRRAEPLAFDHGAQHLSVRTPEFQAFLDAEVPAGTLAVWPGRFARLVGGQLVPETPDRPRLVAVPGMSALAQTLARGVEVRTSTQVARLGGQPGAWTLTDDQGQSFGPFDWVVGTAPPAQTAALLGDASSIADRARSLAMRPCFALMLGLPPGSQGLPHDGITCEHPVLGWAANNHTKPGRPPGVALVLHASHDWSQAHVADPPPEIAAVLKQAASESFGVDLNAPVSESLHRWLYAAPATPGAGTPLIDRSAHLAACGDWCADGTIEGACLSGLATARALLAGG